MDKVICNKAGHHLLCTGCGAAVWHYSTSCEPCPLDNTNHCQATDKNGLTAQQATSMQHLDVKLWLDQLTLVSWRALHWFANLLKHGPIS